jgi:hypothetical protein
MTSRKDLESLAAPMTPTSDRPPAVIDPEKMLAAWNAYHATNLRLIEQFEQAREELRQTRRDNQRTRAVSVLSAMLVCCAVFVAAARGAQLIAASARVEAIASRAGEQLTRVESTLSAVVESVALTNEAAIAEAVEPAPQEPAHVHIGQQQDVQTASPISSQPQAVGRRLAGLKRAVDVLEQLGGGPEVAEARGRVAELEAAAQAMGAPDSGAIQ